MSLSLFTYLEILGVFSDGVGHETKQGPSRKWAQLEKHNERALWHRSSAGPG